MQLRPSSPTSRDVDSVKALVGDVKAAFGRIDILVNSAGIFEPTPIGETTEAEYDATMDINVKGTFFAINEVAPVMIAQGGGKIVNLSSVTGVMGFKTFSVYCASKAAINYLTRALALELSPHNIAVNAILPGNTATPMNVKIRTEPQFEEMLEGHDRGDAEQPNLFGARRHGVRRALPLLRGWPCRPRLAHAAGRGNLLRPLMSAHAEEAVPGRQALHGDNPSRDGVAAGSGGSAATRARNRPPTAAGHAGLPTTCASITRSGTTGSGGAG